jgi:hypothetical protein
VVEQWTENPRVAGSTPALPIKIFAIAYFTHGCLQTRSADFVAKLLCLAIVQG